MRKSALSQIPKSYSIRTDNFRLTRWGDGGAGMVELYDRRVDPDEMTNLAEDPTYRKLLTKLTRQLEARIARAAQPPKGLEVNKNK